jgi:flagellar hook assembly protein FlgD
MNGKLVKTFSNIQSDAGSHQLTWNARDDKGSAVHAGMYLLQLQSGNYTETKKIVVVR